jgi:hypothetical protein
LSHFLILCLSFPFLILSVSPSFASFYIPLFRFFQCFFCLLLSSLLFIFHSIFLYLCFLLLNSLLYIIHPFLSFLMSSFLRNFFPY